MHAAVSKTRPAVRTVPPGARTALAAEQGACVQRPVASGLKLVHTRHTGT
jgi:hypothetical protein